MAERGSMGDPLRILILDDVESEAELVQRELRRSGLEFAFRHVADEAAFRQALADFKPELVLSDYSLPGFNALRALALSKSNDPDLPFIVVTGSLTEETAADCIKAGATDYVLKQHLARLPVAVSSALERRRAQAEQQRAERMAREGAEHLALAVDAAQLGTWDWDLKSDRFLWGGQLARLLGLTAAEAALGYRPFAEQIHTDDFESIEEAALHAQRENAPGTSEFRVVWRDDSVHWIAGTGRFELDAAGHPLRMVGVAMDITERKQAEREREELLQAERRARETAETLASANLAMAKSHEPGAILDTLLDYLSRLVPYDSASVLLLEGDSTLVVRAMRGFEAWANVEETRRVSFDARRNPHLSQLLGERRTLLIADTATDPGWERVAGAAHVRNWLGVPLVVGGRAVGVYSVDKAQPGFFTQEHVRLAEALAPPAATALEIARLVDELREAAEFSQQVIASAQEGIAVFDRDLRYRVFNRVLEDLSGLSAQNVIGRHALDLFPFLREMGIYDELERALRGETIESSDRSYSVSVTGRTVWTAETTSPLRDASGAVAGVIRIVRDVTERRRTEAEIVAWKDRYEAVTQASGRILFDWDPETNAVTWGGAVQETLGYTVAEMASGLERWASLVHPEDREAFLAGRQAVIARREALRLEYRLGRKNGSYVHVSDEGHVISGVPGQNLRQIGFIEDVTERRRLEEQLRQSQKMEAVGQLAGGIAHDFNNILNVITGYGEMLQRALETGPEARRIAQILRAAERASGLTRQLLAFSRKQLLQPRVIDPNALVADMQKMLGRVIGEDVDLRLKLQAKGHVRADPGQFEQVLLNLAVNARDAMPTGGVLAIETADVDLDSAYVQRREVVQPGRYVVIAVSDNGVGMVEAIQERVFEPFFTTKPEGKGTGLGLATVYGIVKQSGGYIWVYSEPGQGSVFRVYLPQVEESPTQERPRRAVAPRRRTETVLVVEDEPAARELIGEVLREEGYQVLLAADGQEGVDLAERQGVRIQAVLTDVILPRLSGPSVAERVVKLQPGVKVLFMSGYTDDALARHGVLEPGVALLQKPFTPDDLVRRLGEILDGPA